MVVDDEADFREPMSALLRAQGYSVVEAGTGADALRYLRSTAPPPAVMLVDLHMHGMSGPDLIAELPRDAALPAPPIVLMSGSSDVRLEQHAKSLGLTTFLRKPIEAGRLIDTIRRSHSGPV